MGELNHYHITMLVDKEKENAIRTLFSDKCWPCLMKVVTDDIITGIIESGFTDVFTIQTSGNNEAGGVKEDKIGTISQTTEVTDGEEVNRKSHIEGSKPFSNKNKNFSKVKTKSKIKGSGNMSKKIESDVAVNFNILECNGESVMKQRHISENKTKKRGRQLEHVLSNSKSEASEIIGKTKKSKFQCSLCGIYLATKASLHRHCQSRHKEEWFEFKCNDCPCMFKKVEELWKHRNDVKHDPPKINPKFSEKKNLSPEELEQLGHLKCNACGKILPSRRLLRRHYYSNHRECMPGPLCAVCGTEFKTRQELWKHKREMKHNDSLSLLQTYQCEECGKILTGGFSSFKLHQKFACKEVEEKPQVPCDVCGSLFKSKFHLKQHKKRTHINIPVVCDICGTVCKNKHSLNSHKRRHDSKNKKHICENCGKAFITNLLLTMHMRTHTKEKPFKCPLCDHRCAIKQNIQKHSLNVHKTQVKCADIVTVLGTELPSANIAVQGDEEFRASNVDDDKLHYKEKTSHIKDCVPGDKIVDFQNSSNYFSSFTHLKRSSLVDNEMYKNDSGKSYQFNSLDVAYDLTVGKQNQVDNSGKEITQASDIHPGSNFAAVTVSSKGKYTELTNCKLNPFSYPYINMDSSNFQNSWENTENR